MLVKQQKNFSNYLGWKQTKEFIAIIKANKYALYSLSQTLYKLYMLNHQKDANELKKEITKYSIKPQMKKSN